MKAKIEIRKSIIKDMNTYIIELGNDEIREEWVEPKTEAAFEFIAENDDAWTDLCTLFGLLTQKEEME